MVTYGAGVGMSMRRRATTLETFELFEALQAERQPNISINGPDRHLTIAQPEAIAKPARDHLNRDEYKADAPTKSPALGRQGLDLVGVRLEASPDITMPSRFVGKKNKARGRTGLYLRKILLGKTGLAEKPVRCPASQRSMPPGTKLSATISALCCLDQCRRGDAAISAQ